MTRLEEMRFDTFTNPLGNSKGNIVFGVDEENRELIPAVASQRVDLAHAFAEQLGEDAKCL